MKSKLKYFTKYAFGNFWIELRLLVQHFALESEKWLALNKMRR